MTDENIKKWISSLDFSELIWYIVKLNKNIDISEEKLTKIIT